MYATHMRLDEGHDLLVLCALRGPFLDRRFGSSATVLAYPYFAQGDLVRWPYRALTNSNKRVRCFYWLSGSGRTILTQWKKQHSNKTMGRAINMSQSQGDLRLPLLR